MIDKDHELPVTRQCDLLGVSRSSVYYEPVSVPEEEVRLMRELDEIHLLRPFLGSRRLADELRDRGFIVNRKKLRRLMRVMGIKAIYPRPKTTRPGSGTGHRVYPYLLDGLEISRSNQVWASDITFIPMARGFAYLVAIIDVYSRRLLSWRLSNSMDTSFCLEALEEALRRFGRPEIFNTDQGSQFTSQAFTSVLEGNDIRISMDGKGRWKDNIFIERFWWSLKYEEVYLHAYDDLWQARKGIGSYIDYYNSERRHSSLEKLTPEQAYRQLSLLPPPPLAADSVTAQLSS
jgi:putative transposase